MKYLFVLILSICSADILAQVNSTDTTLTLEEVIVKAYEQNRQLKQVATAVNHIGPPSLMRFSNTSLVSAVNSTPGVRMEERSPGSYRMNIRGSTLRSPFGVRNVKIYLDEFPLTDPGGDTYLSALSFYNIHSLEIIKGPGGSLYGAGTGGVMLIQSQPQVWKRGYTATAAGGSYGLFHSNLQWNTGTEKQKHVFQFSHLQSHGYRNHTALRRDVINYQLKLVPHPKNDIKLFLLYSNIYYQTPGALTKAEFDANPKAARPATGSLPSAETAKAAIFQKLFLTGISNTMKISPRLKNNTSVYGNFPQIKNPTFRNYGKRYEPQWGIRTVFNWRDPLSENRLHLVWGGEMQAGYFNSKTFTNNSGSPGTLQIEDDIKPVAYSFFAQADYRLTDKWLAGFGLSSNLYSVKINRVSVPGFIPVKKNYNNQLAPRIAISKNIFANTWWYSSLSGGYSSPTVSELLPSSNVISTALQPEHGISYETGIKSSHLQQRLYIEINAFYFELKDAIVQRRDSANADYFVNAGSTRQKGIESQVVYRTFIQKEKFIRQALIHLSHTWFHFRYRDYKQLSNDYSGNKIPGAAPQTLALSADVKCKHDFYVRLNGYYSGSIPLNDANTVFADDFHVLSLRTGWKKQPAGKPQLEIFVGVENLFDEKYGSGNDINAAGGRYYNAAPGRSFFAGITLQHF